MKKILTDAAAVGNAAGRMLNWRYAVAHPDWAYYPGSKWGSMLWQGGANFETPPPEFTREGMFKPFPPTGARTLDSRTAFYYGYTLDSPGMIMRIPDVGSQYLMGFLDSSGNPYDGGKTYKVTLPPRTFRPGRSGRSRSTTTRRARCSTRRSATRVPAARAIRRPPPSTSSDGSTTVYFGPTQPAGADRGNWIQTVPGKGWFTLLRLYSPLEPFFDKSWRPSEIELVP